MIIGLIFVVVSSFFLIYLIDIRLRKVLKPFIDVEVERLTNNIVNKTITDLDLSDDSNDYITVNRNQGRIQNITYNTYYINSVTNKVNKVLQDSIKNIDYGIIDDYFLSNRVLKGKFKGINNGIFCEVSLGIIRNSLVFANVGPTIPIRLIFMGQVNTEIKVETKEYGVNNIMVEIYLIVKIHEMVSMPISSKMKEVVIKEPLSIEIIHGEVPKYIGGFGK